MTDIQAERVLPGNTAALEQLLGRKLVGSDQNGAITRPATRRNALNVKAIALPEPVRLL